MLFSLAFVWLQVDQIVQLRAELMELQEKLRVTETDKLTLEGEIQVRNLPKAMSLCFQSHFEVTEN